MRLLMDGDALARFCRMGVGDGGGFSMVDPRMGSNIWPLVAGREGVPGGGGTDMAGRTCPGDMCGCCGLTCIVTRSEILEPLDGGSGAWSDMVEGGGTAAFDLRWGGAAFGSLTTRGLRPGFLG